MTKDEFLRLLDRKLDVINERERRDIIDEYRTHIEMKMKEGKTEEEIRTYMQKTYFASDEKIDLSIDIAERELEILK